jgi:hypothetical protein
VDDVTGTKVVVVVGATVVVVTLCTAGVVGGWMTGPGGAAEWRGRMVEPSFGATWCVTVGWPFDAVNEVVGATVSTVTFDAGVVAPWFDSTTTRAIPTAMAPVAIQETIARRRSIRTPWLETASGLTGLVFHIGTGNGSSREIW